MKVSVGGDGALIFVSHHPFVIKVLFMGATNRHKPLCGHINTT